MLSLLLAALLAQQSFEDQERALREKLAELEKSRPDKPGREFDAWDEKLFDAEWNYGSVLFRFAEERKEKKLYKEVIRHFTLFIWKRDDHLASLQARIYLARAHLALEETAEAHALAFDLFGQYLADATLRADERAPVEYRRAASALGSGKLDRASEIAFLLCKDHPQNGSYRELGADVAAAQAAKGAPGTERNRLLDEAISEYGDLVGARYRRPDEHLYRLMEKYAGQLFLRDPERARDFFVLEEKRGHGKWDEGRWGYRDKLDALRKKVFEAVPPRKR